MKRYNLSEIMKRAWRMHRDDMERYERAGELARRNRGLLEGPVKPAFGEALKRAWAGARFEANTNPNNFEVGEFIIWEDDGIVRSGNIVSIDGRTLVARLQRSDFEMTLRMGQIDKTFILNRNSGRAA